MNYKFNANIRPTETYYIPNQWKFYEDFGELYRLKIASLIEADNSVSWSALFYYSSCQNVTCIKVGLSKIGFSPSSHAAVSNMKTTSKSS